MEVKQTAATVTIFQNMYSDHFNADIVYICNQKHKYYLYIEAIPTLKGIFVSFYDFKF